MAHQPAHTQGFVNNCAPKSVLGEVIPTPTLSHRTYTSSLKGLTWSGMVCIWRPRMAAQQGSHTQHLDQKLQSPKPYGRTVSTLDLATFFAHPIPPNYTHIHMHVPWHHSKPHGSTTSHCLVQVEHHSLSRASCALLHVTFFYHPHLIRSG